MGQRCWKTRRSSSVTASSRTSGRTRRSAAGTRRTRCWARRTTSCCRASSTPTTTWGSPRSSSARPTIRSSSGSRAGSARAASTRISTRSTRPSRCSSPGITTVQHLHGCARRARRRACARRPTASSRPTTTSACACPYSYMLRDQNRLAYEADEAFVRRLPPDLGPTSTPSSRDRRSRSPISSICSGACWEAHGRNRGDRARIQLAPANLHWCSDAALTALGESSVRHVPVGDAHAPRRDRLPARVRAPAHRRHGARSTSTGCGLLGPRLTLGHGVWLTERDIERVAAAARMICHNRQLQPPAPQRHRAASTASWRRGVRVGDRAGRGRHQRRPRHAPGDAPRAPAPPRARHGRRRAHLRPGLPHGDGGRRRHHALRRPHRRARGRPGGRPRAAAVARRSRIPTSRRARRCSTPSCTAPGPRRSTRCWWPGRSCSGTDASPGSTRPPCSRSWRRRSGDRSRPTRSTAAGCRAPCSRTSQRFYDGWLDPGSLDPFYRQSSWSSRQAPSGEPPKPSLTVMAVRRRKCFFADLRVRLEVPAPVLDALGARSRVPSCHLVPARDEDPRRIHRQGRLPAPVDVCHRRDPRRCPASAPGGRRTRARLPGRMAARLRARGCREPGTSPRGPCPEPETRPACTRGGRRSAGASPAARRATPGSARRRRGRAAGPSAASRARTASHARGRSRATRRGTPRGRRRRGARRARARDGPGGSPGPPPRPGRPGARALPSRSRAPGPGPPRRRHGRARRAPALPRSRGP